MNLKEYIQSEIKSQLTEDLDLDQAFNDAEPVEEGVMSELDILAKEAKDLKSFVKNVFKEFDNLPKTKDTLKWLEGIYNDSINELFEAENPCWKGYEMVGMKTKDGKEVPNCVPKKESVNEASFDATKLNVAAGNQIGSAPAEKFLSKHKIDLEKLFNDKRKGVIDQYEIRDIVQGKAHKFTIKQFLKKYVKESVNEGVSPKDMEKIKGAVEAASSFMNIGSELKKMKMRYIFATSPMPVYIVQPTPNNKVAIVNKKYADTPDFVVGDTAVGVMENVQRLSEGSFSEIDIMIQNAKTFNEFVREFYKDFRDFPKDKETGKWLKSLYSSKNESVVNEAKGTILSNKILDFLESKKAISGTNAQKVHKELTKYIEKLFDKNTSHESVVVQKESLTNESEQLDEKLITFSNRAPYGQIVFMAGGSASGKGFAINNFIDAAGFKVRDVDKMKSAVGKLDQLGKFSIDDWFKKYASKLSEKDRAHVEEFVVGKGMSIADVANNLKNPNNVAALHYIVEAMGLKDKWLISMLSDKTNKETLPNLLFDITAKKVSSITNVIKPLVDAGYDAKNIHLIWVLTDYHLAVQQNKNRERVVADDTILATHEGAAKTIWGILTSGLPSGLNGRIDVILNKRDNTVTYNDSKGNKMKGAVKGFLSLPVKNQGGGTLPENVWKSLLYNWISDNGPKTVDLSKPLDRQMRK